MTIFLLIRNGMQNYKWSGLNKTEILKSQIRIGKIVEEINDPEVREVVEGNYRIIYRIISKNELHIVMVHHGTRDFSKRIID